MPGMPAGFASGPPPGGSISPSQLASQAAYTVLGNPTASPASPIATTDPVVSGSATAARFLGSANNTAAAPTVLLEPSGNSGWRWDGTLGDVASVDAVDRLMLRVNGTTEISSGLAGGAVPVAKFTSAAGSSAIWVLGAAPEGVLTANAGQWAIDVVASRIWFKRTGTGNTGWVLIDRCESGTYTPTGTIVTNLDSVTPSLAFYSRVGDIVTVAGSGTADATAAGQVSFRLTIPVASNFAAVSDASGTIGTAGLQGGTALVQADATNDALTVSIPVTSTAAQQFTFLAMYRVL